MSKLTASDVFTKQVAHSDLRTATEIGNGPQVQHSQNTSKLDKSQEMGPLATKIECPEIVNSDITYYGIYIPSETQLIEDSEHVHVYVDKTEALKAVKRYKKARFKTFKTREEAVEFAINGSEIINSSSTTQTDGSESASPLGFEKLSLFKGPKAQDLVQLRKQIECGDLKSVSSTVWTNPRYLVSSGDTPAILQEGSRYNALHVAAKARNTAMCEFIIQTVSDPAFVGLLYGDDDPASCQERAAILLDLYLNTPDKGLNETPLHFAVKFGAVGVVEALVSCPQCDKNPKNKFGQTPKDIVCSRISGSDLSHNSHNLKKEIMSLLEERFYVPVLRSEDNSIQPIVGSPFSPTRPLALNTDPINPRMEIHAYAGPMSHDEAVVFRKKWKTPPRIQRTQLKNCSSVVASALRLQDTEKGLERVGRELAQEFRVSWKEFWPFLGIFTDLSTPEGLQKLEVYLKNRFMQVFMKSPPKENIKQSGVRENLDPVISPPNTGGAEGAISPISDLCLAFKACSLSDTGSTGVTETKRTVTKFIDMHGGDVCANTENDTLMTVLTNPGLSPFLYVEKSCQVFAKRISDGLVHLFAVEEVMRDSQPCSASVFDFLLVEVKHLQVLVNSYMDDPRFVSVDFHLIHSRIASLVATKIHKLSSWDVELIISYLQLALLAHKGIEPHSSDEEDIANSNVQYEMRKRMEKKRKKSDISSKNHVKCLAQYIVDALTQLEENESISEDVRVDTEDECMRVWSDAITCTCSWHMQNLSRNSRKGASLKRSHSMKPVLITDVTGCHDNKISSFNCISRRLSYSGCDNDLDVNDSCANQNTIVNSGRNDIKGFKYQEASDTDEGSESDVDEAYYTPPTSPEEASSEEEMATADEGIGVYIEGENPSKMDLAVLQAIQEYRITAAEYPNVYRWKHLVLLHSEKERNSWASPATLRRLQKSRVCCAASPLSSSPRVFRSPQDRTSPQPWHRITGRYTPLKPNCHAD